MEPSNLRKSLYMGPDCSEVRASWKSGLFPFSTWQRVNCKKQGQIKGHNCNLDILCVISGSHISHVEEEQVI